MKKNTISIVVGTFTVGACTVGACFKIIRNNKKRKYTKLFDIKEIKKQNEEIWGKEKELETKVEELETKIEDANKVLEKVKETA